jgi:uncharacterized membrane protein YidH (DUF202 family)
MNKDLVLREYLAIERTRLANETTLLAYIRTGLYFLVAGSTLGHLIASEFWADCGHASNANWASDHVARSSAILQAQKIYRGQQKEYWEFLGSIY